MIEIEALNKSFKVARRQTGTFHALKSLIKPNFQTVNALNDVSFSIDEGEIVGYIGPNGAGKSTTIKIMSGILVPDSGKCSIMGKTPWKNRIDHVKNIGVVFGQRSQLWWDTPVIDSMHLLKDIYKVPEKSFNETLELLTETLDLSQILSSPVRQLSLGQRMRAEIAGSLIHSPKILFLDEPTIGLDAVSKIAVRKFIKTLNQERKTTVILTTHDMSDIEALASRILLIGKGHLLKDGSLDEIKNKYITHKTISIDHHHFNGAIEMPGVTTKLQTSNRTIIDVDLKISNVSKVIANLTSILDIIDVTVESRPVEELIVELYKEYEL